MWFMGRSDMTTTKSTALGQMSSADALVAEREASTLLAR
jgi:hypothetical protein